MSTNEKDAKDGGGSAGASAKEEDNWYVECSDEEVYTKGGYVKGQMKSWEPPPEEMVEILEKLDKEGAQSLTLDWTCPGRRPLTPSTESEYSDSDDEAARLEAKAAKDFDFDADDDMNVTPTMARRNMPGSANRELKGSARKRTTNLKSILSSMERHRKMDEAEKKSSTPSTPTTSKT